MADSLSYSLLKNLKEPIPTLELQGRGQQKLVREVKSLLTTGGFYRGVLDGTWDSSTEEAFRNFKEKAYLEFPNVLGTSTAQALLELAGEVEHKTPLEAVQAPPTKPAIAGSSFRLPNNEVVYCNQLITGCRHFTWGEATKNGARIPANNQVINNIIKLCGYLERVRAKLGDRPLLITSFYRDRASNRACGGVENSRHLLGDAVDFICPGIQPLEVYRILNSWHESRGGLGRSPHFTHLDLRGYYARFSYGR